MVRHQAVESSERTHSFLHQFPAMRRTFQVAMDRNTTLGSPTFRNQVLGLFPGGSIIENNFGSGLNKKTHGGRTNASRATANQRNFPRKGQNDSLVTFLTCHKHDAKR